MSVALPDEKIEQDPKGTLTQSLEDLDDPDFSTTPCAEIVSTGLSGLVMALSLCPEAAASGKRTKMIHKKGELEVEGTGLKLKWNVDYKGGSVINARVVTLKSKDGAAAAEGAAGAGAGAGDAAASSADIPAAPVAGRKRARKEPTKPEDLDVKAQLLTAVEALNAQGKSAVAEEVAALLAKI